MYHDICKKCRRIKERGIVLLTIQNYVKAKSLEEAYTLNQARSARIAGGMMWLRLGDKKIKTIIDLSDLGLEQIEETDQTFRIGAMCTLRQLEQHQGLKEMYGDAIAECVRHIVGVQFRNQATVGGSIYGRYGFSDVLTCLLALDTYVELYKGGMIPLAEFAAAKKDKDVLVAIVIPKSARKLSYKTMRITQTDFPILAVSVAVEQKEENETWYFSVGARPQRAELHEKDWSIAKNCSDEQLKSYAHEAAKDFSYSSNMRGSAEYREHLAEVFIYRAMCEILAKE